jgi:hypothetical protein
LKQFQPNFATKARKEIVSDSVTKVSLNDTTPEQLFKAMAMVQNELSKATVKG